MRGLTQYFCQFFDEDDWRAHGAAGIAPAACKALYNGEPETRLLRKLATHSEIPCEVFSDDFMLALGVFLKLSASFP